jgi:probable HAF family extracellular repeat protein
MSIQWEELAHMKFTCRFRFHVAAIITSTLLAAVTARADYYSVTPLGTLGGTTSYASAINASGQVVGYSTTAAGATQAFLYSNGTMQDLGTLGGTTSRALGINDHGDIVGASTPAGSPLHAFLLSGGVMTDLAVLANLGYSEASAIDNSGRIVGGANGAFLYSGGSVTNLGGTPKSTAISINASGQIVGELYPAEHAFLYADGTMHDLGSIGSSGYSIATDINDFGSIVGFGLVGNSENHAFLFDTQMHDLGAGQAYAINNAGQIVGCFRNAQGVYHGGLFSHGVLQDLDDLVAPGSGWTITDARAINDEGCIAAYGTNPSVNAGATQALLLTPIPEPASLSLMIVGAVCLLHAKRSRRPSATN